MYVQCPLKCPRANSASLSGFVLVMHKAGFWKINVREKPKGQSRMNNLETLTTLDKEDTRRSANKTKPKTQHNIES